ncbi:hypothetical protein FQZ97_915720 [compost metagenome]
MPRPVIPQRRLKPAASVTERRPEGNGRPCVLAISLSRSFSLIWLITLAEAVTRKEATPKIRRYPMLSSGEASAYPKQLLKTTVIESLNLVSSKYAFIFSPADMYIVLFIYCYYPGSG